MALAVDIVQRYLGALASSPVWIGVAVAWAVGFSLTLLRPLWFERFALRHLYWGLLLATLVGAGALAVELGWVADDAFISFRYVRNWVNGEGLVYNPGQRVEGYTNFLWVVVLAPFEALGLHLAPVSLILNLISQAATLLLVAHLSITLWSRQPRPVFSLAAALLASNYVFASFGTSGLETMFGAFLVLLSIERAQKNAPMAAGTAGILAAMTHPDHAIFYVAGALALLITPARRRQVIAFAVPFIVLYVPYFLWRYTYYGDLFPNTYYAKNADLAYFSQGARYLLMSGLTGGLIAMLPLCGVGMLRFWHQPIARITAIALPLFVVYVAKIGGDFMLGRLLCPLLAPVFILAELGVRDLVTHTARVPRSAGLALLALACTAAVPASGIGPYEKYLHVADERTFYPVDRVIPFELQSVYWDRAHRFNALFASLSRKPVLAMGALGIIGHETSLPMVDNYGLVNRQVAHWRNKVRGRPGHEKLIGPGLLVGSGADLSDIPVFPNVYSPLGRVQVDDLWLHAVRYDRALFDELAAVGVKRPGLLTYITKYSPARGPSSEPALDCDLWYMNEVYFRHNQDAQRRDRVIKQAQSLRPDLQGAEAFMLSELPAADHPRWQRAGGLTFDSLHPDSEVKGSAFRANPTQRERIGQHTPFGVKGGFINSHQDIDADAATGRLTTQAFEVTGEIMTLQVAGGRQPDHQYVELIVDGQRWFSATGCDSELLGRRVWVTRALIGSQAKLRVVDRSRGAWGHILVDELVQWKRR